MEIQRLSVGGLRLPHIRLRALADAPGAFGSTYASICHPLEIWQQQLQEIAAFVAGYMVKTWALFVVQTMNNIMTPHG